MNKKDIILIGGGGHCKSVIDVIEEEDIFNIKGIIDVKEKVGEKILGYEIIGNDKDLAELVKRFNFFHISLGFIKDPTKRIELYELVKNMGAVFPVIKSPLAHISRHSIIEEGTIVMHGAIVNAEAKIGCNCIINSKSLIEHDAEVGNHCHISTGAIINGGVKVGSNSFVGSGCITVQGSIVPINTFVRANSLYLNQECEEQ